MSPFVMQMLSFGLAGVAGLTFAEKLIPILPSYVLLLFIGMTVACDGSALPPTIVATVVGSVAGALCWYSLGRVLGAERVERLVARFGRYIFVNSTRYERMARSYRRNVFWVTFVGQTIPTVRIYLALPAGVLRLPHLRFLVATILGSFLWNAPLVSLGYVLRNSGYDPATAGLAAIAVIVFVELTVTLAVRRCRTPVYKARSRPTIPSSRRCSQGLPRCRSPSASS